MIVYISTTNCLFFICPGEKIERLVENLDLRQTLGFPDFYFENFIIQVGHLVAGCLNYGLKKQLFLVRFPLVCAEQTWTKRVRSLGREDLQIPEDLPGEYKTRISGAGLLLKEAQLLNLWQSV